MMQPRPPDWASLVRNLFADLLPSGTSPCRQHLVVHCTPLIASTMVKQTYHSTRVPGKKQEGALNMQHSGCFPQQSVDSRITVLSPCCFRSPALVWQGAPKRGESHPFGITSCSCSS